MNIKELIECYIEHRRDVITRRTQFRLRQAEDRAHILEGYKIALDNLDDFVRIIRSASNREDAKTKLMAKYPLSDRQATAILELRLYQLTGLERDKIEAEYLELIKLIEELRSILASDAKLLSIIKAELLEMRAKYSNPRKTEIIGAAGEFRMEDVIPNEGCVITVSHLGFIKRTPVAEYRSQKRGGKGVMGTDTYEEDFVETLFTASTHDYILFLTSTGQCLANKVYDIPEGARATKGKSVSSFLRLAEGEKIAAMICVQEFSDKLHLAMATKAGVTKKTNLADYTNATREGGLRGIKLEEGDTLVGCVLTNGENEIVLVSHKGQAVRFKEDDLRDQGRDTVGVTGMRFKIKGDYVEAICVCDPVARLLVAREDGIGKRTPFEDYRLISRGGTGVIAIDLPDDESVSVAGALSVRDEDEVMLLTAKGQSVRTRVKEIRETGRGAKGVKLVELEAGDKLLSIARIVETEEEQEAAGDNAPAVPTTPAS
jgi:DNA gyrase subunit A